MIYIKLKNITTKTWKINFSDPPEIQSDIQE
jgi:hypothetical protein